MASSIQLLRSTIAQERPFPGNLLEGQPAVNLNSSEPGLFFKTADGSLVKFGPAAITSDGSPPNSSPQGSSGNTVGELWLDKSTDPAILKVYDGATWVDAGSGSGGGGTSAFMRWIYTAIGGETSLSGSSGGVALDYTPGLEEVYVNGVLITRGSEYSATNGFSITNLASPLTAGDVVTVISMNPASVVELPGQVTLLRWSVLASSGQTVLSGLDSSGQSLGYSSGLEEVYVNGAFLRRGLDYVATDGSSITLTDPLALADEVTVLAWTPFVIGSLISDADVATDAAIVSSKLRFTPNGLNGQPRDVQSKLRDIVSVRDFGAQGNGVADDAPAINAAIESVRTGFGASAVYFPSGTYYISTPIILRQTVTLVGLNKQNAPNASRNAPVITTDQPIDMIVQTENLPGDQQSGIYDLFLDGQNIAKRGVYFQYARGSRFERVVVMRCREYGFYMDNPNDNLDSFAWDFNQCYVNMPNNEYPGAPIFSAYYVKGPFAHFFNCKSDGGLAAFTVEGTNPGSSAGYSIIQNCHSEGFKVAGVHLKDHGGTSKVLGCTFISSTGDGIGGGQSYIKVDPPTQTGGYIVSNNTLKHFGVPDANTIGIDVSINAPATVTSSNTVENMAIGVNLAGPFNVCSANNVGALTAYSVNGAFCTIQGGFASCDPSGFIVNNTSGLSIKVSGIQTPTPTLFSGARPLDNTSTFKAIGSSTQTLPATTWFKILLNGTKEWDPFSEFNSSTFEAEVDGYYNFSGIVTLDTSTSVSLAVYKNGVSASATPLITGYGATISTTLDLTAGDIVELYAFSTVSADTVPTACSFEGYLLNSN